jgi:hypothetical protein
VIVALGAIAHQALLWAYGFKAKDFTFGHNVTSSAAGWTLAGRQLPLQRLQLAHRAPDARELRGGVCRRQGATRLSNLP